MPNQSRILIIDDDANVRQTLALILQQAGYQVAAAANGRAGLEALEAQCTDLVFLDVVLPDIDGRVLLPQIRQRYPRLPVVVLTGLTSADVATMIRQKGANGFLVKPAEPEQIVAIAQECLAKSCHR